MRESEIHHSVQDDLEAASENEVNVDELLDFTDLEDALDAGTFESQSEMYQHVAGIVGEKLDNALWERIFASLFPEYREKYEALPRQSAARKRTSPTPPAVVAELHQRHTEGESISHLARTYGLDKSTVSRIVNNQRRKEVA